MKAIRINGLAISKKNSPHYRAYKSWSDQRQRCGNPNDTRYKWWGAKGIKVEYTSEEFVLWWEQQRKLKPHLKRPNCSRKDHKKNYSLDNIELLECSANSIESWERSKRNSRPVIAIHRYSGVVQYFDSAVAAHQHTKVAKSAILSQMKARFQRTIRCEWIFICDPKPHGKV